MRLLTKLYLAPVLSLLALGALPIAALAQDKASDNWDLDVQWTQPSVISSRGPGRGGFASFGLDYTTLNGRSMTIQEFFAGIGFTDAISLYVGRQVYDVKGRTHGRFAVDDNIYGGKYVLTRAHNDKGKSAALEFQVLIPNTATASYTNSFETFDATKDVSFAADFGPGHGWETQVAYASVKGAFTGEANVYSFGVGKDIKRGPLMVRLQAQLIDDNLTTTSSQIIKDAVRPVLFAGVKYDVQEWFRLEADGTLFTSGLPLAGTEFTGISSFQIYNPGGISSDLRHDFIGIASLRAVFHGSF